jgi:hypothetical protein
MVTAMKAKYGAQRRIGLENDVGGIRNEPEQ